MKMGYMLGCVAVAAVVTYIIRSLPFVIFRNKIQNVYIQSFLYYVPYAVMAAMIFPSAVYATGSIWSGIVGLAVAFIVSFFGKSLMTVALAAAGSVFVAERILHLLGLLAY